MKVQTKQPNLTQQQAKPSSLPWQPVGPSSSNNSLPASYSNGQSKVAAWLQESEEMDKCAEGKCKFDLNLISQRSRLNHTSGRALGLRNKLLHNTVILNCEFYFQSLHGASPTSLS